MLHGVINFDKPVGITSAKALYRVRSITRQRKSGHAGTLDPAAAGVLVLCLGKATKLVESIMNQPKVYRATARLDVTSASFDSDRPLATLEIPDIPSADSVREALHSFVGIIEQVPPQISAIKIGGRPAYQRTTGQPPVVLKPRPVEIYWAYVYGYEYPHVDFEVCCGRGTYIRALIRDLGERLASGGCLTSLVRERVGPFCRRNAWNLESMTTARAPEDYLIDVDRARDLLDPGRMEIPAPPQANPRT